MRPLWLPLIGSLLMLFVVVHILAQAAPAGPSAAPPPVPYLVKDINSNTLSSAPRLFVNWHNQLYFAAQTALWASDGTAIGTVPLFDPPPHTGISSIFATDKKLFFTTAEGLWAGDGTEPGSELIADLGEVYVKTGLAIADTLFLVTTPFCDPKGDCSWQLWSSDGTVTGTQEIASGEVGGPYALVGFDEKLYFLNSGTLTSPPGLYTSDGTAEGTVLVTEIPLSGTLPSNSLNATDELLFFLIPTGFHQYTLWQSDGTSAGTTHAVPQNVAAPLGGLTSANGLAYFFARDSMGHEGLWQSDGTAVGTTEIAEVTPCYTVEREGIAVVNDILYFCAYDAVAGEELWRSDGTAVFTYRVKDIQPGVFASLPGAFIAFNGSLFFWAGDGTHGREFWRSDGTEPGTMLVKDIYPGVGDSGGWTSLVVDDYLFFAADDGRHGSELWGSDGTTTGTSLLRDINSEGESSLVSSLFPYQDRLFFAANDGNGTFFRSLWASDGTAVGTGQFLPQSTLVEPYYFTQSGDGFYFIASGRELWYSNGTLTETKIVTAFQTIGLPYINELTDVNGSLFFRAHDETHGSELWLTGNATTTTVMIDILPGNLSSSPQYLTNVNGTLFFQALDTVHGVELWRSNGTISGTILVKDIVPGSEGAYPQDLINSDGTLFFFLAVSASALQLWKSDGTESGTILVRDDIDGQPGYHDRAPIAVNGILYFVAWDGWSGNLQAHLWKSDGTDAGTTVISTHTDDVPNYLTILNETVYFLVDATLWKSNGTSAGTTEIFVHPSGTRLSELTAVNGKLFFSDGTQPWQSDGTAAGTFSLPDVTPWDFTGLGDIVFFIGDDDRHGTELWAINPNRHFFMLPILSYGAGSTP